MAHDPQNPKPVSKGVLIWIVIILGALVTFQVIGRRSTAEPRDFLTFLEHVDAGEVARVELEGNRLHVDLKGEQGSYPTAGVLDDELIRRLATSGVVVRYAEESSVPFIAWILLPILLIVFFFFFVMKRAQDGSMNVLTLGKSQARTDTDTSVSFADVGGLEPAKEHLADVIDYLQAPERWADAGVRLPRGVLLVGPPGCGKTLLARAVAGEAGVSFFNLSASEFVEMFVGVGAARVRDLFDQARKQAPSIVFIDELDAVGRRRGSGIGSGHDEREQTLNQLLVCLDGFDRNDHVVAIAATNRADVLDRALLRPGRFDIRIQVDPPGRDARFETLAIHARNKKLADDVSLEAIADRTAGFSGADLENVLNEAALLSMRDVRLGKTTEARVVTDHCDRALSSAKEKGLVFDKLDAVLIESMTQLAQPTGGAVAKLSLRDGSVVEGDVVWADAGFVKIRERGDDERAVVVPKSQLLRVEALAGTDVAGTADALGDRWAHAVIDTP